MSYEHFLSCIKTLEQVPKTGTLFDYSERLTATAMWFYPAGLPRLVDGRIVSLINTKKESS